MNCYESAEELLRAFKKIGLEHTGRMDQRRLTTPRQPTRDEATNRELRCYNCNTTGHIKKNCTKPARTWGSCYRCGSAGHRANNCTATAASTSCRAERTPEATDVHLIQSSLPQETFAGSPVLENQEDSQVVDSRSTEQDADATSTEDPMLENQEDSQVADSGSMGQNADATPTEDAVLGNQEDSQVADAASMEQDINEASAEEAQAKLEISTDPIEASSEETEEEASMPDARKLPENDENERVKDNDTKLMAVDTYSSESEKSSVPEYSSPEDVSQLSQKENQASEKYRVKVYVGKNDVLYRVVDVPLVVVPTPMQAQVVCRVHGRGPFEVTRTEALLRRDFWFKGPYKVIKELCNKRYVVADLEGFQLSQKPYQGVWEPANMRPWHASTQSMFS